MSNKNNHELDRNMGFFAAFSIGTGTMIGAGIFVLPKIAISNAGPAVILSFLLGGLISLATAISLAELATGMPKAGGSYYFISRAMGPIFGTIIGVGAWLGLVFKGSFALVGLADYFNNLVPAPLLLVATIGGIILIYINYKGAESSGLLQNIIVIALVSILGAFVIRGSFEIQGEYFTPFMPYGYSSVLATTGMIFVAYLGIAKMAAISEEVKNPGKNLPRAFISSVIFVTLLYLGVMFVVNGLLPFEEVVSTNSPLLDAAEFLAGKVGFVAMIIAGFFATVSTANAALLSSSRFPFAMGRDNLMPDWFVAIHKEYNTPFRSIIATGITMIVLFFLFDVEQLAKLGSVFNILIFVLVNISVVILRYNKKEWYEPEFRDPFYPFTQIFGVIASLSLLPQLGFLPIVFAVIVVIAGYLWFKLYGKGKAIPQYNLFDMIEKEEVSISMNENKEKVTVSLANPEHEHDLLRLASFLGERVLGLHVIKVPMQTDLQGARKAHEKNINKNTIDHVLENSFEEDISIQESRQEYLEIFSHDVSNAIITTAEREKTDLLLMGWKENNNFQGNAGSVTEKVMKESKNHTAILKGHLPQKINKIIVPFGGGENARYALFLARKLADRVNAKIKLLRVINPEASDHDRKIVREELNEVLNSIDQKCDISYEIKDKYSKLDTIIDEAPKYDIMFMGDSNERFRSSLLGNVPRKVALNVKTPLILVRRYRPISREGFISKLPIIKRKRKKAVKNQ